MKIALVNLCKLDDYALTTNHQNELDFLTKNNIVYEDYASGRATYESQLAGFNEAIENSSVDLVWFVRGGSTLIKHIDVIDWNAVKKSGKVFWGLSDFTHFAMRAVPLGITCYYGQGLKDINKFFPDSGAKQFIVDFLSSSNGAYELEINGNKQKMIGGLVNLVTYMLLSSPVDLSSWVLFLEYHGASGETYGEVEYYFDQLKGILKTNKPQSFVLGHSMLLDQNQQWINYEEINSRIINWLADYKLPVYTIDHFTNIIKLG